MNRKSYHKFYLLVRVFVVRCGAVLGNFQHRTLQCSLAKTMHCTLFLRSHVRCGAVQSLVKTITAPHLIFVITCAILCIRCGLKSANFLNFGLFLLSPKLIFPFLWAKFLIIKLVFIYFGLDFLVNTYQGYQTIIFFFENQGY